MNLCYLNKVYENSENEIVLYECILSTSTFQNIESCRVDLEGLKKFAEDETLCTNFTMQDDYLRCDILPVQKINNIIADSKGKHIPQRESKLFTIYDLITIGLDNNFFYVNSNFANNQQELNGIGFTHFRNLKFSESTMSVYFHVKDEDGLRQDSLIFMKDGCLILNDFYFAAPLDWSFSGISKNNTPVKIGAITLNGTEYLLYKTKDLALYDMNTIIAKPLVNKASVVYLKNKNIYNVLNDYSSAVSSALYKNEEAAITWSGSGRSLASPFGVYYKANCDSLTSDQRSSIINKVLKLIAECKDAEPQEIIGVIKTWRMTPLMKLCAINLAAVVFDSTPEDALYKAATQKENCARMMVLSGLYLYKVRSCTYITKTWLVPANAPIFGGSDEYISTIAKEIFNYADTE